eukprot:CAMPEP_0197897018 /NCGR_PEP_ID=MMETSP1439-20131203/41466_1 /TAXON_ID=66791 /ORGANISM="Gonyaulax spinifera, Strain CCMP409" /LENGTH=58 /DNA_ID=CAMNT_0043517609 /DNA_START=24 /DNA_END=197 /DNA_ORIENTATION=+
MANVARSPAAKSAPPPISKQFGMGEGTGEPVGPLTASCSSDVQDRHGGESQASACNDD